MSVYTKVSAEDKSVSIVGLSKGAVLAALYNGAQPFNLGYLQYDPKPMDAKKALEILDNWNVFDYLKGRALKVDLSDDKAFDPSLYDYQYGQGAAAKIINVLRDGGTEQAPEILKQHIRGLIADYTWLSEAKAKQLNELADGDLKALNICIKLLSQYKQLNPKNSPEGEYFFNCYNFVNCSNPKKSAQEWYAENDPFDLLEHAGIKGREITELFSKAFDDNNRNMYINLAIKGTTLLRK